MRFARRRGANKRRTRGRLQKTESRQAVLTGWEQVDSGPAKIPRGWCQHQETIDEVIGTHDMITEKASLGEIQMLPDWSPLEKAGEGTIRREEMASRNWTDSLLRSRNVCCDSRDGEL